jgi:glycosyltransferase involved in cell wall biosynthesis
MERARPIKIMQVIARMNVGGPAVIVADLMLRLNTEKFEAILVTGYCADNEADYLEEFGLKLPVTRISGLGRSVSFYGDLKSFLRLVKLIRNFKPDIIHTHTAKAGLLGRLAGLIAYPSAKRIHTFHGHLLHSYFSPRKTQLIIYVERVLALFSTKLVSIGNQVKEDLLVAGVGNPNQYSVIFPGLKKLKIQSKTSSRHEIGLMQNKIYIVFVGRLTQIKRPDRLIEISQHLKDKHPNTGLIIAGAGEKLEEIQELAKKESLPVIFLGWRNDIGRILSASDIAILCSDNEGIPLTLIQASQAGLPIISTNVGSVSDIVVDGETGLLTETNAQSLNHALDVLLSNPAKMIQIGLAGKARSESHFSLSGMIQAHEELYSQVIRRIN